MKVKFYLSDKSKDGKSAIRCYVREFNNTLALNTGERINPELWDKKKYRANLRKTKNKIYKSNLSSLNRYLDSFENKIFDIVRTVRSQEHNAGFSIVAEEIKKQFPKKEITLFSIFDEFLIFKKTDIEKPIKKATIQKYERMQKLLNDFQKVRRTKLYLERVATTQFIKDFFAFMVTDKNMINDTAYKNIQFLKAFLNWGNKNGYIKNKGFKEFTKKSFKGNEENEVVTLTKNEFLTLYNMVIDDERLERVRDLFIFQCSTGVRYSDIQNISREDIHGATWKFITKKTEQLLKIPLSNYALSILAKYKDYPKPLPVISNQKMNIYVKELCKLAGIDSTVKTVKIKGAERIVTTNKKYEVIGTHTARRTFISLLIADKVPSEIVMKITGHKSHEMMDKYLKIDYGNERDEIDRVFGSTLKQVK